MKVKIVTLSRTRFVHEVDAPFDNEEDRLEALRLAAIQHVQLLLDAYRTGEGIKVSVEHDSYPQPLSEPNPITIPITDEDLA